MVRRRPRRSPEQRRQQMRVGGDSGVEMAMMLRMARQWGGGGRLIEVVEGKSGCGGAIQPLVGSEELRAGAVDDAVRVKVQMVMGVVQVSPRRGSTMVVVVISTTTTATAKMAARLGME